MVSLTRSSALAVLRDGLVGATVPLPEVRLICPCARTRPDAEQGVIVYAVPDPPDPTRTFERWSWHEVVPGRNLDFSADMRRDMVFIEAFGAVPDEVHRFTCHRKACGRSYDVSVSKMIELALTSDRTEIVELVLGRDL